MLIYNCDRRIMNMKLRKWTQTALIIIAGICILMLGADSENIKYFIYTKILAIVLLYVISEVLKKYGRDQKWRCNMKLPLVIRQQRKINTLENKLETLEQSLKEKLYKRKWKR